MSEKFELNKHNLEADDVAASTLRDEGMELQRRLAQGSDSDINPGADAGDRIGERLEASLDAMVRTLSSIADRIQALPASMREEFMGSIQAMTGDKYPAYDAIRTALTRAA